MSSTKQKLRLAGAFAALAALALAVSCQGFFPPEQLASITIFPATPTVPLGSTLQLSAYGTNEDNSSAGNITSKVLWSSSSGTIGITTGGLLSGNDLGSTATITASYQAVTATASASVCVENGTNFTMTFLPSNNVESDESVTIGVTVDVSGISGAQDVTAGVTWSASNTGVTITAGDPAEVDLSGITASGVVTIFGTYTCNGVNTNFQANLTVTFVS